LAETLAYLSGEEGVNFLVQMILPAFPSVVEERVMEVSTLWATIILPFFEKIKSTDP
jgi:hypothetical protein